ncbi:MAG: hypothetical protein Q9P44_09045 [Anaerolineae bacterium]|nr:hypothetical protein [Anaerolineae bacterium]
MQEIWEKFPRKHLLIIGAYYLIAMIIVGQSPTTLLTRFIGSESSDIYEMARGAWWFKYALQNGEPLFYQTLLGYPDGIDGAVLMTVPTQYLPISVLSFVLPLNIAYNVIALLWMALNGWSMYWLMCYLLNDEHDVAALLSGLIYMTFPLFQGHLSDAHGGLIIAWFAPLYLWALFRLVSAKTQVWRWILASVLFFYLTTTGHILLSIYVLMPITGAFGLARLYKHDWKGIVRIFIMGIIASILLLALLIPAINSATSESAYTETQGFVRYSSDSLALISPSFFHPLFANLDYSRAVLGTNLGEGMSYIGFFVGILIIIGIAKNRESRWWLMLGFGAWVLSLGSLLKVGNEPVTMLLEAYDTYIILPFALLENLPVFNLARTPARFTFTVAIAVAVIAGYGAAWLWQYHWQPKQRWRYGLAIFLAILIVFDYQSFWGQPTVTADIPQAVYDLRERDDIRAIFNVPYQHVLAAKDALFLQTAHEAPLIAGQITRQTPVNPAKLALLQATFDPALLDEAGVDIVIFHQQRAAEIDLFDSLQAQLRTQLGQAIYEDERIAIYEVPPPETSVDELLTLAISGTTDSDSEVYFFAPQAGWIDLTGRLQADNRDVDLRLNSNLLHRWTIDGEVNVQVPIHVPQRGFYALRLALNPPCPINYSDTLQCRNLTYDLEASFIASDNTNAVTFEDGISLESAAVTVADNVDIRLLWYFDAPRTDTDIRFVHIINESGEIELQSDVPSGVFVEEDNWAEIVSFTTDDLQSGDYTVRVGWYDFNTLTNYQAEGQAAIEIDSFSIED